MKPHMEIAKALLDFPSDYDAADRMEAIGEAQAYALLVIADHLAQLTEAVNDVCSAVSSHE